MTNENEKLEPSLSTLILSIGSSAAISLGLSPNPATGQVEKDLRMARFNIDLLEVLQTKTKNNLSKDEEQFLSFMISDLQMRFVQSQK